jgi:hypothetical protein
MNLSGVAGKLLVGIKSIYLCFEGNKKSVHCNKVAGDEWLDGCDNA